MRTAHLRFAVAMGLVAAMAGGCASAPLAVAQSDAAQAAPRVASVLTREQAGALMPATVFFQGKTAPIQARNAAGLHLANGQFLVVAVVDTSGYASAVAERYQAYLLTEFEVRFGDRELPPGAYGIGFVGHDFLCMDLGGNELLRMPSTRDDALQRPTPLQIVAASGTGGSPTDGMFRLYSGRSYVALTAVPRAAR